MTESAFQTILANARSQINWPSDYHPQNAPLYACNHLVIPASPATVWAWLTYAENWPQWYPNAQDVDFVVWPGPFLQAGSVFKWTTFGFRLTSTVHDFETERRLAWIAVADGVKAYHTWYLHPLADGGTLLITDETQISTLGIWATEGFTQGLIDQHDIWLAQLSVKAQSGLPSDHLHQTDSRVDRGDLTRQ